MKLIHGALGAGGCLGLLYWLIVIGEGSYLGPWAVRLVYRYGARIYDRVHERVTAHDQRHLLVPLRVALAAQPRAQVLDVATGTARLPLLLARQPWFDGRIEALDLSPHMLAVARAKLAAAQLQQRVRLHRLEADSLPWPADHFDLVSCLEALEYFRRPRHTLSELLRVLRPGGSLLISAWPRAAARWLPGRALSAELMAAYLRAAGCDQVEVRGWQPGHYDLIIARKRAAAR